MQNCKHFLFLAFFLFSPMVKAITFNELPSSDKEVIGTFDISPVDTFDFKRLSGGYSGSGVFLAEQNNEKLIFKVLPKGSKANKTEISMSIAAASLGVAPEVIFPTENNLDGDLLVIGYIGSKEPNYDDIIKNQNKYIATLQGIHSYKFRSDYNLPKSSYGAKEIEHNIKNGATLPEKIFELNSNINNALTKMSFKETLIHGDLHEKQIIVNNDKIYVIDWRNAGSGDPFYDVASFTTISGFTLEESIDFFNEYMSSNASKEQHQRFMIRYYQNLIRLFSFVDKNIKELGGTFKRQNDNSKLHFLFRHFSNDDLDLGQLENLNALANSILDILDNVEIEVVINN